jgi:GTP-binding protein HflX
VADSGHARLDDHLQVVDETLDEIGAGAVPSVLVLNKCDTIPAVVVDELKRKYPGAVAVSALRQEGLTGLKEAIAGHVTYHHRERCLD